MSDSIDLDKTSRVYGLSSDVTVKNSIEIDSGDLQLVGDLLTPSDNNYYGTNREGEKGFFSFQSFNVNLDSSESSVTVATLNGRTVWTVTHGLNSLDVSVEVFRISNGRTTNLRIDRTGLNTLEASRAGTIAEATYRIIIK